MTTATTGTAMATMVAAKTDWRRGGVDQTG